MMLICRDKMNLREHMEILAVEAMELAIEVGSPVTSGIVERAMNGLPIPAEDAARITAYLAYRFGHNTLLAGPYLVEGIISVGLAHDRE